MTPIHYLGNEKIAVSSAHGNSKAESGRNFIRISYIGYCI